MLFVSVFAWNKTAAIPLCSFLGERETARQDLNTRNESGCDPGPVDEFGLLADQYRPLGRVFVVF
jgi:hypothetical protein